MKRFLLGAAVLASLLTSASALRADVMTATEGKLGFPMLFVSRSDGLYVWNDPSNGEEGKGLRRISEGRFRALSAVVHKYDTILYAVHEDGSLWQYNPKLGGTGWLRLSEQKNFTDVAAGVLGLQPGCYLLNADGSLLAYEKGALRVVVERGGYKAVTTPHNVDTVNPAARVYALRTDGAVDEFSSTANTYRHLEGKGMVAVSAARTQSLPFADKSSTDVPSVYALAADGTLWENCVVYGGNGWHQLCDQKGALCLGAMQDLAERSIAWTLQADGTLRGFAHSDDVRKNDEYRPEKLPDVKVKSLVTGWTAGNYHTGRPSNVLFVQGTDGSLWYWPNMDVVKDVPHWVRIN